MRRFPEKQIHFVSAFDHPQRPSNRLPPPAEPRTPVRGCPNRPTSPQTALLQIESQQKIKIFFLPHSKRLISFFLHSRNSLASAPAKF